MINKLTKEDLLRIAKILKTEAGIEIKVMPNHLMIKRGLAILIMHPDDMDEFKEIFEPQVPVLNIWDRMKQQF